MVTESASDEIEVPALLDETRRGIDGVCIGGVGEGTTPGEVERESKKTHETCSMKVGIHGSEGLAVQNRARL